MASITPNDPRNRRTARQGGLGMPNQSSPTSPAQGGRGQMPRAGQRPPTMGSQGGNGQSVTNPNFTMPTPGDGNYIPAPWASTPGANPWTGLPGGGTGGSRGGQWGGGPVARANEPMEGAFNGQGSFQDWFMNLYNQSGSAYDQNWLNSIEGLLNASGSQLTGANAQGERTKIWDPTKNDWVRVGFGEGRPVWNYQNWGENGQGAGGNVFSDPATSQWEGLLRQLVDRLNQPQPTYTDAQKDLMQTQAIDPLERSRQAQKQNTTERFASRGINPGSGVLEQALQDVDRQFDQMKTGQQSQFALNQVGREDQLFNSNEQRALAGLNLFGQIPQYADKRLQMAQGMLTPSNPYQLMALQNQIGQQGQYQQNYNQQQDQAFWNWLGQMVAGMF